LDFKTVDGFEMSFSSGATASASHNAPCPFLRSLDGGEYLVPENDDTTFIDNILLIKNAGFKVSAYINSEGFVGTNSDDLEVGAQAFKDWCDTNADAQAFINSQSYHTKSGYPDRKYMFCYAEYVIKYYSEQYGEYLEKWIFDDAGTMQDNGDDYSTGDVDDQRIYEAFANAARAGNDDIAVAFNNGRSTIAYDAYPYSIPTRFDDFTFGHAFGGNNNPAVYDGTFDYNYRFVSRMAETDGYVHDGGNWTWDDNILGNFHSKLSTTAWSYGPNQAWEQDDFNEWNAEALSAGGMMQWDGSYNRTETALYSWVYTMLKACDDYLYARDISVNGIFTPDPNKTYYIDCPMWNRRLAATGSSEDAYMTSTSTTGSNVEWKFVDKGNGCWHIDRAAGGSLPRLRTDKTDYADMQATSSSGGFTYWEITESSTSGRYLFTLPDGPAPYQRLQVDKSKNVRITSTASTGSWTQFTITPVH
jgi:hypothetical protein